MLSSNPAKGTLNLVKLEIDVVCTLSGTFTKILDPGFWIWVPRSWIQDPGSWTQDPGSRILDHGSSIQETGSHILDLGSWIQDPGFNCALKVRRS